jgi:hypothetical protein
VSVSARTRFEILKRDGFRCRYCGVTSVGALLHVDHVPSSKGGPDDPANLVTACSDCNLGKSDVPLDESRIDAPSPLEAAMEHAEQIRAYLDAQKVVEAEKEQVVRWLIEQWRLHVCEDPLVSVVQRLRNLATTMPLDLICEAMRVTGAKEATGALRGYDATAKYFGGVLRRMQERDQ